MSSTNRFCGVRPYFADPFRMSGSLLNYRYMTNRGMIIINASKNLSSANIPVLQKPSRPTNIGLFTALTGRNNHEFKISRAASANFVRRRRGNVRFRGPRPNKGKELGCALVWNSREFVKSMDLSKSFDHPCSVKRSCAGKNFIEGRLTFRRSKTKAGR